MRGRNRRVCRRPAGHRRVLSLRARSRRLAGKMLPDFSLAPWILTYPSTESPRRVGFVCKPRKDQPQSLGQYFGE
jgi:hypothetical protein